MPNCDALQHLAACLPVCPSARLPAIPPCLLQDILKKEDGVYIKYAMGSMLNMRYQVGGWVGGRVAGWGGGWGGVGGGGGGGVAACLHGTAVCSTACGIRWWVPPLRRTAPLSLSSNAACRHRTQRASRRTLSLLLLLLPLRI